MDKFPDYVASAKDSRQPSQRRLSLLSDLKGDVRRRGCIWLVWFTVGFDFEIF